MPPRNSLNVSLTPELADYIAAQVASGRYRSASEVVRDALRLLQDSTPPVPPVHRSSPNQANS